MTLATLSARVCVKKSVRLFLGHIWTTNNMENVKRGKLKLKNGSKLKVVSKRKHKKKQKKASKCQENEEGERHDQVKKNDDVEVATEEMTPAQRRHAEHQKKRVRCVYLVSIPPWISCCDVILVQEQEEIKKLASKTYRERIEELNQHLGSLTEHHDVPRVCYCCCMYCVVYKLLTLFVFIE